MRVQRRLNMVGLRVPHDAVIFMRAITSLMPARHDKSFNAAQRHRALILTRYDQFAESFMNILHRTTKYWLNSSTRPNALASAA